MLRWLPASLRRPRNLMTLRSWWLSLLLVGAFARAADALDGPTNNPAVPIPLDSEIIARIATSAVDHVRRAVAIGPHVGGFGAIGVSESDSLAGVTFGLGVYTFDVPTVFELRALIERRIRIKLE